MIDIQHLNKSFKDRRTGQLIAAVRDVSFKAPDGSITALLGPNGAGKTTTLRILSTLMKADGGQAHVGGVAVNTDPQRAQQKLGLLSDARGLYTRLSARENILYYAALRRIEPNKAQQRLSELAEALDMTDLLDRPTQGFSTGEKMKVALARALIHDPPHLIL
nr:ATP-binding cassette domain-containing protein [Burkholderiaceae bacterium]